MVLQLFHFLCQRFNSELLCNQARRQWGGAMPPDFRFCPPDFFLAPPRYFFGRKRLVFLGGKNGKICDFGQKKPSVFGEDLFFFFFFEITRKSLRISAKTFAPLILILLPRSREAGDTPDCNTDFNILPRQFATFLS